MTMMKSSDATQTDNLVRLGGGRTDFMRTMG